MSVIPARRAADLLALNRNVALLLAAIVLIGTGEELWVRFLPKYLEVLGASTLIIGIFDGLKTLLGAVYAYPGGVVVDRWGHRQAFVAFTGISLAGYLLLLAVPHWAAVLGGMFLFLAWTNLSLPATFSLVAESLPPNRHTMGIGIQSLVRRIPVLVGPIAGGLLMDRLGLVRGVHIGVAISIVMSGLALLLQRAIRVAAPVTARQTLSMRGLWSQSPPELKRLLLSDILIRFCERIPFAWVVIHLMNNLGLSAAETGALIAVEMAAAILCYIPAAHYADRFGKEPFVVATFIFFTIFPVALSLAQTTPLLIVAFAIRGLKEFGEPARKALIIGYAPPESRGQVVGAYYLVRDTLVSAGSLLGVALWNLSPQANFLGAALMGFLGTIVYIATLRRRAV